jgi:hypothetical protein
MRKAGTAPNTANDLTHSLGCTRIAHFQPTNERLNHNRTTNLIGPGVTPKEHEAQRRQTLRGQKRLRTWPCPRRRNHCLTIILRHHSSTMSDAPQVAFDTRPEVYQEQPHAHPEAPIYQQPLPQK